MLLGIIALILTVLLGSGMFWYLSHIVYAKQTVQKYPVGFHDGLGDSVFIPLFNAIFVELLYLSNSISWSILLFSLCVAIILTGLFVYYQKNLAVYIDWSKPRKGFLNFGGWYHAGFMAVQIILITYGLLYFQFHWYLLIPLSGYFLMVAIHFFKYRNI